MQRSVYSREVVPRWRRGRGRRVHGGRGARVAGAGGRGAGRGRARRRRDGRGLVVLRGERALVQHVLARVRLGRRLDVHEGDRGAHAAGARARRNRSRALRSTQQLNILDSAIAATTNLYLTNYSGIHGGRN